MTDYIAVDVKTIETALREYLSRLDYDLHKSIESDEETGEDTYDAEAEDLFGYIRGAARQAAGQPATDEQPLAIPRDVAQAIHDALGQLLTAPAAELAAPTNHNTETRYVLGPRERLEIMIRTDHGNMTVWSPTEVQGALDAYRDEIAINIGRDALHDGLQPFLIRLVGETNTRTLLDSYRAAILNSAADKAEVVAIRLHNAGETTASNGANEAMSALRRLAAGAES